MKILSIDDLLAAAQETLPNAEWDVLLELLESSTSVVATRLSEALDVQLHDVCYQPGFGGLCAAFIPRSNSQLCPHVLDDGDPSGDWNNVSAGRVGQ